MLRSIFQEHIKHSDSRSGHQVPRNGSEVLEERRHGYGRANSSRGGDGLGENVYSDGRRYALRWRIPLRCSRREQNVVVILNLLNNGP
jgi:hypothetical protein